jgi:hypothetical protein
VRAGVPNTTSGIWRTSQTVFSASFNWTTTPVAANSNAPVPSKVARMPALGSAGIAQHRLDGFGPGFA